MASIIESSDISKCEIKSESHLVRPQSSKSNRQVLLSPIVPPTPRSVVDYYNTNTKEWREKMREVEIATEPLLDRQNKRDSLYPIVWTGMWDFYKLHLSTHWVAQEIDLSKDINDWTLVLTDNERHYIKHGLAFFAGSDFIVNESQRKDAEEVTVKEYEFFNDDKISRENIHSTTYADLIETLVKDENEKEKLKNAVKTMPSIKQKAEWMREYIDEGTFVERIVAEAIMEGIFFSGTFCGIFWLRKRGLMAALCDSNELIARDEGIHRDFNCYMYRELIKNKLPEELLIHMIKRAVDIEKVFVTDSLPVTLIGMNGDMMCQYIEYVADHLSFNLIGKTIYNVENPFNDWMQAIALKVKADFFVHRPTAYGKTAVLAKKEDIKIRFNDMSF
jgi:ribonucleoside-diphosphate reductase beta chain